MLKQSNQPSLESSRLQCLYFPPPVATLAITMAVGFIRGWNALWTAWLPLYGGALIVGFFYTA